MVCSTPGCDEAFAVVAEDAEVLRRRVDELQAAGDETRRLYARERVRADKLQAELDALKKEPKDSVGTPDAIGRQNAETQND